MRLVLTIDNMDNEAFADGGNGQEVRRILRKLSAAGGALADELEEGDAGRLMDLNGNRVGGWHVEEN